MSGPLPGRYLVRIIGIDSARAETPATAGVRGIRAARSTLGDSLGASLKRSREAWAGALEALSTEAFFAIGSHDKLDLATKAAEDAQEASGGVLSADVATNPEWEGEPGSEAPGAPEDAFDIVKVYSIELCDQCGHEVSAASTTCDHDGETHFEECVLVRDMGDAAIGDGSPFSWEAIAYALTTMAVSNGNINQAVVLVNSYARHANPELWGEVRAILLGAFNDG